jgi:hypothetical protein
MYVVTIANIFSHCKYLNKLELIMSTARMLLDLVMEFLAGLGGL